MSDNDDKILDLGKLPVIKETPDSNIASMTINIAINGGYSLYIEFEDNLHPITLIFQDKIELLAALNTVMLR